ncbi:MAG TPA: antibiotic biosynthesis monooxygenase [Mucilaginibacter sp.]|jgi:quinol monooxygenase YgiN
MITKGLLVKIVAKPGKEQQVADFLKSATPLVEQEPETIDWFAFQISENTFGIFDTFPTEDGRKAHLAGKVAEALMKNAPDLLSVDPVIEQVDLLASK